MHSVSLFLPFCFISPSNQTSLIHVVLRQRREMVREKWRIFSDFWRVVGAKAADACYVKFFTSCVCLSRVMILRIIKHKYTVWWRECWHYIFGHISYIYSLNCGWLYLVSHYLFIYEYSHVFFTKMCPLWIGTFLFVSYQKSFLYIGVLFIMVPKMHVLVVTQRKSIRSHCKMHFPQCGFLNISLQAIFFNSLLVIFSWRMFRVDYFCGRLCWKTAPRLLLHSTIRHTYTHNTHTCACKYD